MSEIRFYLDENVSNDVARGLRNQDIDVLTTPKAGNMGLDDPAQLAFALAEGRVLVTQDDDYLVLNSQGIPHAGIAYYQPRTRSVKQVLHRLRTLHEQFTAEQMHNRVAFL